MAGTISVLASEEMLDDTGSETAGFEAIYKRTGRNAIACLGLWTVAVPLMAARPGDMPSTAGTHTTTATPQGGSSIYLADQVRIGADDLPQDAVRRTIEKEVAARGRRVEIEGVVGALSVRPSSDDRIRVDARIGFWSNHGEWMRQVQEQTVVDVRGDLKADNGSGKLEARAITGRAEITNQFGGVELSDLGGGVVVEKGD